MGWEVLTVSPGCLGVTEPNFRGPWAVLVGRGRFPALRWDPSLSSGAGGWSQSVPCQGKCQLKTQHSATEGKTSANLALHFFNISYDVLQITHFLFVWVFLFSHTRLKAGWFPDPSGAYQVKFLPWQDVAASQINTTVLCLLLSSELKRNLQG